MMHGTHNFKSQSLIPIKTM
jgi:hypothetical protein